MPLLTLIACRAPVASAIACSNLPMKAPMEEIQVLSRHSRTYLRSQRQIERVNRAECGYGPQRPDLACHLIHLVRCKTGRLEFGKPITHGYAGTSEMFGTELHQHYQTGIFCDNAPHSPPDLRFEAFGVELSQADSLAAWHERVNGSDFHRLGLLRSL